MSGKWLDTIPNEVKARCAMRACRIAERIGGLVRIDTIELELLGEWHKGRQTGLEQAAEIAKAYNVEHSDNIAYVIREEARKL